MKNRVYITLPSPTPDAIRNAATKNPAGTWIIYGAVEMPDDMSQWEFNVPKSDVMQAIRDCASNGLISPHIIKGDDGFSRYVFRVK